MVRSRKLWEVTYALGGEDQSETLLILATNIAQAETKARRFLRERGEIRIQIKSAKDAGLIDVF